MASLERLNYLKGIVICHGKSEVFLAKFVCSNLHLNIKTYSKKNGANSIQINSLKSLLNTSPFKSFTEFKKEYEVSVTGKGESRKINNFKLFIIMDTDDCSNDERKKFITKEQFKGHWLYDYIVPIYNIINIAVMSINTSGHSKMACELQMPMMIPKKTAIPPITGIGLRCSLRASGLSTIFFSIAILSTLGCIHKVPNSESKAGIKK